MGKASSEAFFSLQKGISKFEQRFLSIDKLGYFHQKFEKVELPGRGLAKSPS